MIKLKPEQLELIEHCSSNNPPAYNFDKAVEECIEFMEVLVKLRTKHADNPSRPKPEEALKEFGDVIYRGMIALKTINPDRSTEELCGDISAHIRKKLNRLANFRTEGNYKGGL